MDLRLLRYFVAIAEERHFGRAAARLHITQPPMSRAIKQLETELGVVLLHRSAVGTELTAAGKTLYAEASALLAQADQARARVTAAAGDATLTIGTLGDGGAAASRLAATFRRAHPSVAIRFRETDFSDPTAGLRTGIADVALTRQPFDETGITLRELRRDPIGVVLRREDPLADRAHPEPDGSRQTALVPTAGGYGSTLPRPLKRGHTCRPPARRARGAYGHRMHAGGPLERHGGCRAIDPHPFPMASCGFH